jgi:hypothetical protein
MKIYVYRVQKCKFFAYALIEKAVCTLLGWEENPLEFRSMIPAQMTYERNGAFSIIRISRGNSSI